MVLMTLLIPTSSLSIQKNGARTKGTVKMAPNAVRYCCKEGMVQRDYEQEVSGKEGCGDEQVSTT